MLIRGCLKSSALWCAVLTLTTGIASAQDSDVLKRDQNLGAAVARAMRGFDAKTSSSATGAKVTSYTASQPAMGYQAELTTSGQLAVSASGSQFGLRVDAYGRGGEKSMVQSASSARLGKDQGGWPALSFTRSDVSEWYVNEAKGLHHWMRVENRPASADNGRLWVDLATSGSAKLRSLSDQAVEIKSGDRTFKYEGLKVVDAKGSVLPAELKVSGDKIKISVNDSGATYPVTIDPALTSVWAEQSIQTQGSAGDQFGYSVAISGGTAVVGAPLNTPNTGKVYVFVESAGTWSLQQSLTAGDASTGDRLGFQVAIDGDTIIAGAPTKNATRGAAYVYKRSLGVWTQEQKLVPTDPANGDRFGEAVSVSGDYALVGAGSKKDNSNVAVGYAYVFLRSGSSWTQQQKISASDPAAGDRFGYSVAISPSYAIVGAFVKDTSTGAAYAFSRSGTVWTQETKMVASDAVILDRFGKDVALSGTTALIGAELKNNNRGAAYVFDRSGGNWTQTQKLTAGDPTNGAAFGSDVAIDGTSILVGAHGMNSFKGNVYYFRKSGNTWAQDDKFTGSDSVAGDRYGWSVGVSGDRGVVGAYVGEAAYTIFHNVLSLSQYKTGVVGGLTVRVNVQLNAPAGNGGQTVNLASDNVNLTVPNSVVVPQGDTSVDVIASTTAVATDQTATITATANGFTSASISYTVLFPRVGRVTLSKSSFFNGTTADGHVRIEQPAPVGGLTVSLSSDDPSLSVPASVVIPAGSQDGYFTATGNGVAAPTAAAVTGSVNKGGLGSTVSVTVYPGSVVSSVNVAPLTVNMTSNGTVTLANAAPFGGQTIWLSSNNPNVTVPATVVVAQSTTTQNFVVTSLNGKKVTAKITASDGVTSVSYFITVTP